MFKIKARIAKLGIDTDKYNKTLDAAMQAQIRQAAREWLRAVILKVPIWTGTSMGSLQPLGAYLKVAVPNNYKVVRPGYGPSVGKSLQEFKFDHKDHIWSFSFTEEVPHYLVNEYFNVNAAGLHLITPGPYHSFAAGERAFEAYIDAYLAKRVPNLKDFEKISYLEIKG
jgi:hypothetical protein